MNPGIHDLAAADYHADLIDDDRPCLSKSIIHLLCNRSPRHAWTAHPKLNPDFKPYDDAKFDVGTVTHQMLLEGDASRIAVIDAADWRTNAAKEERDAARAAGFTPLLTVQWAEVQQMVAAARTQFAELDLALAPFTDGQPEQTIVWEEDGVVCKARIDWLHADLSAIDDLKTAHDSKPENWSRRQLFDHGGDIQCGFYLRGCEKVLGVRPDWRFIVIETSPPYALSIVTPGADVLAVADAKIDWAIRRWKHCLQTGDWPAYKTEPFVAELPPWADDAKWLVDEYREETAA